MLAHAKEHPTKRKITIRVEIPENKKAAVVKAIEGVGGSWVEWVEAKTQEARESIPWREVENLEDELVPGRILAGLRYREGLTQIKLAQMTGISQHRISEMERGKRSISKNAAKILSKALSADYRLLL
ncbi:MAG: helix-turn-helix domain-containing protein [Deltaproteobacteria bacterium]|nr:helix-turn-helix domain-containing protein [Deltaproteobacteria bacterium]